MTFTINPEDATNRRQVAAPVAVHGGVEGGSRGVQLDAPRQGAKLGTDLMTVLKFSGGALTEKLKQAQEEAFLDGMSQAAQGVAVADIEEERPAWARAFGDAPAVAGARAYEKVADSADLQTQVVEAMPELRRLTPDEFRGEVFRMIKARETGDTTRDRVLMQSVLGWLPNMMVTHTKAHMGWQQAEAAAADLQMKDKVFTAHEVLTQSMRDDPSLADPVGLAASEQQVLQTIMPLPGVNVEEHSKRVVSLLRDHVTRGNLAVWGVAKNSGVLESLDPEQVRMLQNTAREAAARFLPQKAPSGAFDAWRALRLGADRMDEATIRAQIEKVNAEVKATTGIDEVPFITPQMMDDLLYRKGVTAKQEAERAAAEREREARADRRQAQSDARAAAREAARERERVLAEQQRDAMVLAAFQRNVVAGEREGKIDPVPGYKGIALDDATKGVRGAEAIERTVIQQHFAAAAGDPAALAQTIRDFGPSRTPASIKEGLSRAFTTDRPDRLAVETLRRLPAFERAAILGAHGLAVYAEFDSGARAINLDAIADPVASQKAFQDLHARARLQARMNPTNARDVGADTLKKVSSILLDKPFWLTGDIEYGGVPPALAAHAASMVPPGEDRDEAIAGVLSRFLVNLDNATLVATDPTDGTSAEKLRRLSQERPGIGQHLVGVLESRNIPADEVEYIMAAGDRFQVFLKGYRSVFVTQADLLKQAAPK